MFGQPRQEKKDYDRNVVDEQRDDQSNGPAALAVISLHPTGDSNREQDNTNATSENQSNRQFKRYSERQ